MSEQILAHFLFGEFRRLQFRERALISAHDRWTFRYRFTPPPHVRKIFEILIQVLRENGPCIGRYVGDGVVSTDEFLGGKPPI